MDLPPDIPEDLLPGEGDQIRTRRSASAQFVVDSEVGSQALLREAMDPANQSLGEALRLSYRVLQVVILVLVVLFVFSGFQTVEDGQSGVLLRWGKIVETGGSAALEPGLKFSKWPYPAGEFVLFRDRDRLVDLGNRFWPNLRGASFDAAVEAATEHQQLRPGIDGLVLTKGGDIAHLKLQGTYDIDFPVRFVEAIEDTDLTLGRLDADKLVELALERAVVHVAASRTLQEFVEMSEGGKDDLRIAAQELLDKADSGIRLVDVDTPVAPTPALSIKKAFGDVQQAKYLADDEVERARQDAEKRLLDAAGSRHEVIVQLIRDFEDVHALGEDAPAEAKLVAINEWFDSDLASGEVTRIMGHAKGYRSTIERTLGREAERFNSYLDTYKKHPDLVVQRLWMETFGSVLSRDDVEIIFAPQQAGALSISITGLDHIRQIRRQNSLKRREREALWQDPDLNPYIRWGRDIKDGPGRQLKRSGEGLGSPGN